jgi:Flp pilus assembly protein TadG
MGGSHQVHSSLRAKRQSNTGHHKSESGQVVVAFVVLIPVLIMALFISLDLGRYQIMRNQVRIAADAAALAAAGALDISEAANGNFVLNETWAKQRAVEAVTAMQGRITEDNWMTISITSIQVNGAEVEVRINGTADTVFGSFPVLGVGGFNASLVSKARAATGIYTEW